MKKETEEITEEIRETNKIPNNDVITIHPSTLGVSCPRFHWLYARKSKNETFSEEVTEAGIAFEQAITLALQEGRDAFWVNNVEYRIPTEITAKKWEIQKEISCQSGRINIHGYIDIYNPDENWIVDIKSAYDTNATRWKWQMGAYTLPFWQEEKTPRVSIYYARWGIVADIEPLCPEEVWHRVKSLVSKIFAKEEPRGRGGIACWFCPYAPSCQEAPHITETPAEILREVVKLEARLNALKKNLKAFVSVSGSVVIDDARAEFVPVTTLDVDAPQLYQTLIQLGINPLQDGYFVPNRRKVMSIAHDNQEIGNLILIVPGQSRFVIKKTGTGEDDEQP